MGIGLAFTCMLTISSGSPFKEARKIAENSSTSGKSAIPSLGKILEIKKLIQKEC